MVIVLGLFHEWLAQQDIVHFGRVGRLSRVFLSAPKSHTQARD
jgi:hypothetical protein